MSPADHVPRISIALPVRNAAPWLGECLASVFAQTEADFELLAVDDASTDACPAILEDAVRRDARVRLLHTKPSSRGLVPALNLALAEAAAPLLVRMDADDRMHPERLARQAAALDADASLFAVASRVRFFAHDSVGPGMRAYVDWQNSLLHPDELARDRFIESPVVHPSVAMRTSVARDRLGGWRDVGWPEDWDFFLRAFEEALRIGRVADELLEWRQHEGQATRNDQRYCAGALAKARAAFLARHLRSGPAAGRGLWILGAGPVGKELVKSLAVEGVTAEGLADVDPRKIGGVVRGVGYRWPVIDHARLRTMDPRPYGVSAVAGAAARRRVREELHRWGWAEGRDFVVAA